MIIVNIEKARLKRSFLYTNSTARIRTFIESEGNWRKV